MKKSIILAALSALMMLASSCQKTAVNQVKGNGFLSFGEFTLDIDDELITKASAANNNYTVFVVDADGKEVIRKTYGEVKNNGNMISIPAGEYTLIARSTDEDVPVAEFEQPVYGVSKAFSISAGEVTPIGELTCTLLQCKVTVDYSDEFLATVTGECSTTVELTAGYPLEYHVNADKSYDRSAGYFAVNGSTMTVNFRGSVDGYDGVTMSKSFTGISAKQWRQVKFVPKKNEEGTATFDIVINDLISDETLNDELVAEEAIIGTDPNAPQDDGGIRLLLADDCQSTITYSERDVVYDADGNQINSLGVINVPIEKIGSGDEVTMAIKFKAVIPEGLSALEVDITTDNPSFAGAVDEARATHIDLVNPTCDDIIFSVVPFRHGPEILGETEIDFDLSNAQKAISIYPGSHVFVMTITDVNGKTKVNEITMVVE